MTRPTTVGSAQLESPLAGVAPDSGVGWLVSLGLWEGEVVSVGVAVAVGEVVGSGVGLLELVVPCVARCAGVCSPGCRGSAGAEAVSCGAPVVAGCEGRVSCAPSPPGTAPSAVSHATADGPLDAVSPVVGVAWPDGCGLTATCSGCSGTGGGPTHLPAKYAAAGTPAARTTATAIFARAGMHPMVPRVRSMMRTGPITLRRGAGGWRMRGVDRKAVERWVGDYERAWRTPGTDLLTRLFTSGASYLPSPWVAPVEGLEAIARFWDEERESAEEAFTMSGEVVAVDGPVAVVRVFVEYGAAEGRSWRDLWVLRFAEDGRCSRFEEWPFAPGQDDGHAPSGVPGDARARATSTDDAQEDGATIC